MIRTSLAAQCLRLHAPSARCMGSIPGQGTKISHAAWCGKVEREVGGGIGLGNTCKSMADSFQCMTKPTTIKKKLKKKDNCRIV